MNTVWKVLTRKKVLDPVSEESQLGRVLTTFDLTALGVGSTLGVGVYVLAGQVAKETAGPAVVLSFLIATVASVFAGLCYAEFGARAPRAGSAYIYSYVCVGEFVAFVIGWNLILEYVIGSASVARGLSLYVDTLVNDTLKNTFIDIAPLGHVSFMSAYFDFFSFAISVLLAIALAFGLKESTWANNIFTLLNLGVVIFVIVAGGINSNVENWHLKGNNSDPNIGSGGFFPFGAEGVIKGAATCFYGFVGFDCIATTGEEVRNPKKAIPFAIILSLFIIFLAYFGTSTVITLMVPYYAQDVNAPLPYAFASIGWDWAKWIVTIGGIFGLCASLFGAMFPLPRIIYAMASDSLVFRSLGRVSTRFQTPVVGTILAGVLTGLMSALFELKQLVNMMSIGTLLAYTIVAASVLLLRYEVDTHETHAPLQGPFGSDSSDIYTDDTTTDEDELLSASGSSNVLVQLFNCGRQKIPTKASESIVKVEVCLYCVLCVCIALCAKYLKSPIANGEVWAIVITAVVVCATIIVVMSVTTQPKSRKQLSFKVPLVPLIPALSILVNIYLMLMLDPNTWIRFAVWMAIGVPIYYFSVQSHSDARNASVATRAGSVKTLQKLNGYTNNGFSSDQNPIETAPKKKAAPPPPTLQKIEATIADLDQMLENEEANIVVNDRKYSADSLSTASNVMREENVQADVHCSDVASSVALSSTDQNVESESDVPLPDSSPRDSKTLPQVVVVPESDPHEFSSNSEPNVAPNYNESHEISLNSEPELASNTNGPHEVNSNDSHDTKSSEPIVVANEPIVPIQPPPLPPEPVLDSVPIVPPPPPLEPLVIPRPLFSSKSIDQHSEIIKNYNIGYYEISQIKLKPVLPKPETPAVDYAQDPEGNDDNLKFNTPAYKDFKDLLDEKLQQGFVPTQVVVDLKKKPEAPSQAPVPNENVIEESINPKMVKEKLELFLEQKNNSPIRGPVVERHFVNIPTDDADDRELHKRNMKNILGSIKLRKEDSFKSDNEAVEAEVEGQTNSDEVLQHPSKSIKDDKSLHRQNMDGVFKSIRLRKGDESQ